MSLVMSAPLALVVALALLSFLLQRHHVLMCLLSLEATLLALAFGITLINSSLQSADMFYCIIILSFAACEAAVALAVLVIVTRSFGTDLLSSMTTNKC